MTKDNWIKAFDEKFPDTREEWENATSDDIKSFISQVEKDAIERGYKQRDNEIIDEDNLAEAEEAHRTEEGYCCACGYDMAVMEGKIKDAIEKTNKRWRERTMIVCDEFLDKYKNVKPDRYIGIFRVKRKLLSDLLEEKK